MQKPAAHGCGRVLGGRIDCDENTLSDRTSQSKAEVFIHSAALRGLVDGEVDPRQPHPIGLLPVKSTHSGASLESDRSKEVRILPRRGPTGTRDKADRFHSPAARTVRRLPLLPEA